MTPKISDDTMRSAHEEFIRVPLICVAALVLIYVVPKSPEEEWFRLGLTVAYFAVLLRLLWHFTSPLKEYLEKLAAWKFSECLPAVTETGRLYFYSISKTTMPWLMLAIGLVSCTALRTLSLWISALIILRPLAVFGWWICIAGFIAYPWLRRAAFRQIFNLRSLLDQAGHTTTEPPRVADELNVKSQTADAQAMSVVAEQSFTAGGVEWHWRDFYQNCVILGQPGAGKTSCVLNTLLDGLIASSATMQLRPSGLILDPKGDFRKKITALCKRYGRENDLVILDPSQRAGTLLWNPLIAEGPDDQEVAGRLITVLKAVGVKDSQTSFWMDYASKLVTHSLTLLRLTNPSGEPPSFRQLRRLVYDADEVSRRADRLPDGDESGDLCLEFFAQEWTKLADQTRSSVQAYLTNMLEPFLHEPYATVFGSKSTHSMAGILDHGKILYVSMPAAEKETMSRLVCALVKLAFFREVLRRRDKARPSFFLCDEFQSVFTASGDHSDTDSFGRSRQSNHANIIATQNINSLLHHADKESTVKGLLSNCAVKFFLRNTDTETNKYASELFGTTLEPVPVLGEAKGAEGASRQYVPIHRPEVFAALAIPSRSGAQFCEALAHAGSREQALNRKLQWKVHPLVEEATC